MIIFRGPVLGTEDGADLQKEGDGVRVKPGILVARWKAESPN